MDLKGAAVAVLVSILWGANSVVIKLGLEDAPPLRQAWMRLISGFNFVVNLALLRDYRPSALSAFFLTQPIFGVVAAALVAGDPLTPELVVACAAVAVGIGLASR